MGFLIDGYNLLFALGLASRHMPAPQLQSARDRLLLWLNDKHPDPPSVLIIFDAREAEFGDDREHSIGAVRVRYSTGRDADDLLEDLIREERVPAQLTVVSNDHRVQRAGQRRGCIVWGCGEFVDWLEAPPRPTSPPKPPTPEKPESVSDEEMDFWLREFEG